MLALILAAVAAEPVNNPAVDAALQQCRPKLAKEVLGDIGALIASASSVTKNWTVVRGTMTASIRMPGAPAGSARTHHLGRIDYDFVCWVSHKKVRKITVNSSG